MLWLVEYKKDLVGEKPPSNTYICALHGFVGPYEAMYGLHQPQGVARAVGVVFGNPKPQWFPVIRFFPKTLGRVILGLYGDNGKENGNYQNGLYRV